MHYNLSQQQELNFTVKVEGGDGILIELNFGHRVSNYLENYFFNTKI